MDVFVAWIDPDTWSVNLYVNHRLSGVVCLSTPDKITTVTVSGRVRNGRCNEKPARTQSAITMLYGPPARHKIVPGRLITVIGRHPLTSSRCACALAFVLIRSSPRITMIVQYCRK